MGETAGGWSPQHAAALTAAAATLSQIQQKHPWRRSPHWSARASDLVQTPPKEWAVVAGALSKAGGELARACMRHGYGVLLVDGRGSVELEELAARLNSERMQLRLGCIAQRAVPIAADTSQPSGVETLHRLVRQRGHNVQKVIVVSSAPPDLRPLSTRPLEHLQREVSAGVLFAAALCKLFATDLAKQASGQILLVGVCAEAQARDLQGSCVSFLRALHDVLYRELAFKGVDVSFKHCTRLTSLKDLLSSTCMSSLAQKPLYPSSPAGPAGDDHHDDWSGVPDGSKYRQLASAYGFPILPLGEQIDRLFRSKSANLANVLMILAACGTYAFQTLPLPAPTQAALRLVDAVTTKFFVACYLARWWSRGLRLRYLLKPAMVLDLLSLVPSLASSGAFGGVQLKFLKIARILRFYRFFQPQGFRLDDLDEQIKPYHVLMAQAIWVLFALLYMMAGTIYEAEKRVNPQFGDFFSAMYFSLVALSTAGFGDLAPVTAVGRTAVTIGILAGLCILPYMATAVTSAVAEDQLQQDRNEEAKVRAREEAVMLKVQRSKQRLQDAAEMMIELEGVSELAETRHERLRRIFDTLDEDGDGALAIEDVARLFADAPRAEQADQVAARLFEMADADGSGYITYDEFARLASVQVDT